MITHAEFVVFTLAPICLMVVVIFYSSLKMYELDDRRPLLLIGLLALMTLHQFTEVSRALSGTYYTTTSVPGELFESSANLLASTASHFVFQHVTDLRRTRTELEAANATLEERSSMVSVLNRVLRHNVRNDINVIAGQATYLRKQLPDDQFHDELAMIEERAWELAQVSERTQHVRELLIDESASTTEFRLCDCLEPPVENVGSGAPAATVAFHRPEDGDVRIDAPSLFPVSVADVVDRIVTANDGSVHVDIHVDREAATTEEEGEVVTVSIADDSDGLPDEDVEAIQLEEETRLNHGKGLSIWCLKWTVERAGGELLTRPDDATIEIRLPRAD